MDHLSIQSRVSHSAIVESGRGRPFRGVQGSLTSRAARASTCPYYFRLPRKIRVRVRTKTLVQNINNVSKMLEIGIIMKSLRTRGRGRHFLRYINKGVATWIAKHPIIHSLRNVWDDAN